MADFWSGAVGGRPVRIWLDPSVNHVVVSTTLAADEEDGGLVAGRRKGEPVDLSPDVGETWAQVLAGAGFTDAQATDIIRHLPRVLDAE